MHGEKEFYPPWRLCGRPSVGTYAGDRRTWDGQQGVPAAAAAAVVVAVAYPRASSRGLS